MFSSHKGVAYLSIDRQCHKKIAGTSGTFSYDSVSNMIISVSFILLCKVGFKYLFEGVFINVTYFTYVRIPRPSHCCETNLFRKTKIKAKVCPKMDIYSCDIT